MALPPFPGNGSTVPIAHDETWWVPGLVWVFWIREKFLSPVRNKTPDHSAHSLITKLCGALAAIAFMISQFRRQQQHQQPFSWQQLIGQGKCTHCYLVVVT